MSAPGFTAAEGLIARVLGDRAFRTGFRRDPGAACREAGYDAAAAETALGRGPAPQTLDPRESRSSLAGVLTAAVVEGVGAGLADAGHPAAREATNAADAMASGLGVSDGAAPAALGAVREAQRYLGTPYASGGETPQTGFDCSGLVQWAYRQQHIRIPRTTYTQIDAGAPVGRAHLLPGDLVFFARGTDVHHVGMSLGGARFVHSPHTGDVVKISSLDEAGYAEEFAGARRIVPARPGGPTSIPAEPSGSTDGAGSDPVARLAGAAVAGGSPPPGPATLVFAAVPIASDEPRSSTMSFLAVAPPDDHGAGLDALALVVAAAASYPGDDAAPREIAAWMGDRATAAGLPPELPVMAALQESSLRNLPGGTGDSVGYFQMARHVWSRDYWGYPERPELQMRWFVDQALEVRRAAVARGDGGFGTDPATWGAWIAAFERPAAAYRDRYQQHLATARGLLRAA